MGSARQLTKIELGSNSSTSGAGFNVERVIESSRLTLKITIPHGKTIYRERVYPAENPEPRETVFTLRDNELVRFCASLNDLLPTFEVIEYIPHPEGCLLFRLPSRPTYVGMDEYSANLFFFEDGGDHWDEFHNKCIANIQIFPPERTNLARFALDCLSEAWGLTTEDSLRALSMGSRALYP